MVIYFYVNSVPLLKDLNEELIGKIADAIEVVI